jgi:hypothetical protein
MEVGALKEELPKPSQDLREEHRIRVLNVAGSKASEEPGIAQLVSAVLSRAFAGRLGRLKACRYDTCAHRSQRR